LLSIAKLNIAKSRVLPLDLKLGPDRPDVLRSEWRLRSDQFALIPGCRLRLRRDRALVILHGASPLLQRITSMRYFEPIGIAAAFEPMQSGYRCTGGAHRKRLTQSGNRAAAASSAPPTLDDTTAFGFLSNQLAREGLRDFKLRSPEDYADSMTSRALVTKEWSAIPGL
jgi:hypothetical protein